MDTSSFGTDPRPHPTPSLARVLAKGCGLLAAAFGFIALTGWLTGIPFLASFASDTIPMAPSTALFFLFYGIGTFALVRTEPGRTSRWIAIILGALALLAACNLFLLSLLDIHPEIEHLGLPISGTVNGAPLGHMSPLTAFCFILVGSSFLLALSASRKHPSLATAAFWCASAVSLQSITLGLAYLLGAPLLYGSGIIPPALPTALAFLFVATAVQLATLPHSSPRPAERQDHRTPYHLILIFALLAAGIVTTGFLSFRKHEKEFRLGMEQQLSAIVALKAARIGDWLAERRTDAAGLTSNRELSERVERWLMHGMANEREGIAFRLDSISTSPGYDGSTVLDADGRPVLSRGERIDLSPPVMAAIAQARNSGRVADSGLYRDTAGKIRLIWVAPIQATWEHPPQTVATVLFSTRAEGFLFPFIEAWPTVSRSAETLLVRRDGNKVLFLNNLKFKKNAALMFRIPLGQTEIPAVQAVLGKKGIVEGRDYRGIPVIAAIKPVAGVPWFLIAKMDQAEVFAPLRDRLWSLALVILALLIGSAAAVILQWQSEQHDHRFALLAQAAEKDRQLAVELEKRVDERTAQLDAANKELEFFSFSVSHDLKAPLRGIDGYSRLLEEAYRERLDAEGQTFLANIRQGVSQMHRLIEDLLAYSRMERRNLQNVPVDLAALVQAVAAEAQAELTGSGITLTLAVPALSLSVDRDGLVMALRNLLDNARKFSRNARPPVIEIGGRTENDRLRLWVRDNGIGFDPKFHDRIFEIFSRLERAEDFPGTGVGLALVRKAMQRMGGRAWAESAPGRGAVFYLELPLIESAHNNSTSA